MRTSSAVLLVWLSACVASGQTMVRPSQIKNQNQVRVGVVDQRPGTLVQDSQIDHEVTGQDGFTCWIAFVNVGSVNQIGSFNPLDADGPVGTAGAFVWYYNSRFSTCWPPSP